MKKGAKSDVEPTVLMFHSVADYFDPLPWKPIVCSVATFDSYLSHLKKAGFTTVSLSDYIGFLNGGESLPPKPVVLTFDDGYMDNWVNAFPILKKYGFKATVYVTTDFIDPRDMVRKTLEDYWEGKTALEELDWYGYLSWNELRVMVDSGVFEVGSHAVTHTWHFSSPEIVDFHRPDDPYVWFEWNRDPARKPFWMMDERDGRWGSPVYSFGPALTTRIYRPSQEMEQALTAYVRKEGGTSFFNMKGWRERLFKFALDIRKEFGDQGDYEGEQQYWSRAKNEVISSKRILEDGLGRKINTLAWPNDAHNSKLVEFAYEEAHYELTCMVEDCGNEAGEYPWVSRTYIGEKYGSWMWNNLWFRAKMAATGDDLTASLLKAGLRGRDWVKSLF